MKILTVYYSLDGNTQLIAEQIKSAVNGDILRLKPVHDNNKKGLFKLLSGGRQVFKNEKPELEPFDINPAEYDLIFIGTPVWAGSFAPALNTFLAENSIQNKNIALFCCSRGGKGKVFIKLHDILRDNNIIGETEFLSPVKSDPKEVNAKVSSWVDEIIEKLDIENRTRAL